MPRMNKVYHFVAIYLLAIYFAFNGLSYVLNYDKHGLAIDSKISNTESMLIMRNINVKFSKWIPFFYGNDTQDATYFSCSISIVSGLLSMILAFILAFFDDKDKRNQCT